MNVPYLFGTIVPLLNTNGNSEQEIIRLEKKLLLEVRTGKSIDTNEADEIISLIKNYYTELLWLSQEKKLLYFFLRKPTLQNTSFPIFEGIDTIYFTKMMETFFVQELKTSIDYCFQNQKFAELIQLKKYRDILPYHSFDHIETALFQKIEAASHIVQSNTDIKKLETQAGYILKPEFYKLLTEYYSYNYDSGIREIINKAALDINHYDGNGRLKFYNHFFYNLFLYKTQDEDLEDTIKNNYEFSKSNLFKTKAKKHSYLWAMLAIFIIRIIIALFDNVDQDFGSDNNGIGTNQMETKNENRESPVDDSYHSYSTQDCNNNDFFVNLNLYCYNIRNNDMQNNVERLLEEDINTKLKEKFNTTKFLSAINHDLKQVRWVDFKNSTDRTTYILLRRACPYGNSILIIPPKSNLRTQLLNSESFKILLNGSNSKKFQFVDFKLAESNFLYSDFTLTPKDSSTPYMEIFKNGETYESKRSTSIKDFAAI